MKKKELFIYVPLSCLLCHVNISIISFPVSMMSCFLSVDRKILIDLLRIMCIINFFFFIKKFRFKIIEKKRILMLI